MAKEKTEQKQETESLSERIKKLPKGLKESQAKQKLGWNGDAVEFREAFLNDYLRVSVRKKEQADGK